MFPSLRDTCQNGSDIKKNGRLVVLFGFFSSLKNFGPLRACLLNSPVKSEYTFIHRFFLKITCGFWGKEKNYAFLFFFLFLKKKNSLTPLLILRRFCDAGCDGRGKKENIKHRFVENFSRSFQDARIYSTPL